MNGVDVNWRALASSRLIVEIIKRSTEALVEDCGAAKGKGAVCADGESTRIDGTLLRWTIELELVIRSDVSSASMRVEQLSTRKGLDESARASAADDTLIKSTIDVPLAGCCRDILDRDHERARECWRASRRSSSCGGDVLSNSLRNGVGEYGSRESSKSECVLHLETCSVV